MSKNGGQRWINFGFDRKLQKNILTRSNVLSLNRKGFLLKYSFLWPIKTCLNHQTILKFFNTTKTVAKHEKQSDYQILIYWKFNVNRGKRNVKASMLVTDIGFKGRFYILDSRCRISPNICGSLSIFGLVLTVLVGPIRRLMAN